MSKKNERISQELCIKGAYVDDSWAVEITRAMLLDTELTFTEKAVLSIMMVFTDCTNWTEEECGELLTIKELRKKMLKYAGLGKRELDYFIEKIADAGWISVQKTLDGGYGDWNEYIIIHKKHGWRDENGSQLG